MASVLGVLRHTLIALLAFLIALPPAHARIFLPSSVTGELPVGTSQPVWDYLAQEVVSQFGVLQGQDEQDLARLFFADYLDYLNAVGIGLAVFEGSIQAEKEIRETGQCSSDTLHAYEGNLKSALNSDLSTFTNTYCQSTCRIQAKLEFGKIAHIIDEPSCEESARKMYNDFNCEDTFLVGFEDAGVSSEKREDDATPYHIDTNRVETPKYIFPDYRPGDVKVSVFSSRLPSASLSTLLSSPDHFEKVVPMDFAALLPSPSGSNYKYTNPFKIENKLHDTIAEKKAACVKKNHNHLRITFDDPKGRGSHNYGFHKSPPKNPFDPRWTTLSEPEPEEKPWPGNGDEDSPQDSPCKLEGGHDQEHYTKLFEGYQSISVNKIYSSLAHWPIFDENGRVETEYLRLITFISDQIFYSLINELEAKNKTACMAASGDVPNKVGKLIVTYTLVKPGVEVPVGPAKKDDDEEEIEVEVQVPFPENVANYFSGPWSFIDSFVNGVSGSTSTGAATRLEHRAAALAGRVQGGSLSRDDIGARAQNGPLGYRAVEIERKTQEYLAQGSFDQLKYLAAEVFGGVVSGSALAGAGKAVGSAAAGLQAGKFSSLFEVVKESIRKPLLAGGETGAWQIMRLAKKANVDIVLAEKRFGKAAIDTLSDENVISAASRWGISKSGMNQLFEHTVGKDALRLAGLERRAGLTEGALSGALGSNSEVIAKAMKQMDILAQDVIENGISKMDGLKTTFWKPGVVKPADGIGVIQYDGKLQSLQPMTKSYFDSL